MATWQNKLWAGLGYRAGGTVVGNVGINLMRNNALRLGGSFDWTVLSRAAAITSPSSYEVMLGYALPAIDARKKPIVRTPRFRY